VVGTVTITITVTVTVIVVGTVTDTNCHRHRRSITTVVHLAGLAEMESRVIRAPTDHPAHPATAHARPI
jgi:hypothetical protein